MKLLFVVLLGVFVFSSVSNTADMINHINSVQHDWEAGFTPMSKMSKSEFKALLGTHAGERRNAAAPKLAPIESNDPIPKEFDARKKWPGCVGPILDQGHCGSCWAFGAVEALQDRFCIHSKGAQKPILSEQDITSCNTGCMGCNGGWLDSAWQYLENDGTVTEKCYPYEMGTCKHPGCPSWPTPDCKSECKEGSGEEFQQSKHFAKNHGQIESSEEAIQREIMTNGPVEVAFSVYEDFAHYKSGVYRHISGQPSGGHAVKNIGWGVTKEGTKYWIIQNSWNTDWGMDGYFWILRGSDECGIESDVWAGLPKLD